MERLSKLLIILFFIGELLAMKDGVSTHYVYFKQKVPFIPDAYFNPNVSWQNKWLSADKIGVERFYHSSRALVFVTDFWHLCGFLITWFFAFAIAYAVNREFLVFNPKYRFVLILLLSKIALVVGYFVCWELLFT